MQSRSNAPIGIFDSGIGGMTVARAVKSILPHEQIIYFGDTAHLPYGDKSTAAIQAYSIKICDLLLAKKCKVILIACNSASAAAYDLVKEYCGTRAQAFNVIDPVVDYVREHYKQTAIGLIGTHQTVSSGVYRKKIELLEQNIQLQSLATPLLVPMIEEGFHNNRVSGEIIHYYLEQETLQHIQALILGCTHYPIIKDEIEAYYQEKIEVIDSASVVAQSLKAFLTYHNLQAKSSSHTDIFMVSDFTPSFEAATQLFFGSTTHLDLYQLWE